jgi:hypothetical protein
MAIAGESHLAWRFFEIMVRWMEALPLLGS